ncbi:DNA polymerase III subunit beta [Candidatus Uhrbacteria bacterium]|nr:DNA polymerase III subunit beta [Candidatus Uhrbacteria bacterium]
MRFSCIQENLASGLMIVSRIAARAGNLPILSHIHIKAENDGILLKATNLEVGATYHLRGKIEEEGEFTVPAKLLTDYVFSLPKEKVDVGLKDGSLHLVCGTHQTAIKGMPAADFPFIPVVEAGVSVKVPIEALSEALGQVIFTVSPTETRVEISGALFAYADNRLTVAGTDSYRLAEKILLAQGEAPGNFRVIVPVRALQELERICQGMSAEGGVATLVVSESQLAVLLPGLEFVSRLIEGPPYPDYRAIVPSRFGCSAALPRAEFIGAVKAAGLFSKAGIYDIGIEFNTETKSMRVEALNSQTGEHQSSLAAEAQGVSTKVAFNWKYLLDGLQAVSEEKVVIKATDSSSPSMLTGEKSTDYFYIVMPIKE